MVTNSKRRVKKNYYLETRADVLCRNQEVFAYWRRLGLEYMFLGLEAIDEDGLKAHRKRSSMDVNTKALEIARAIGVTVAINLIAEPDWDERRFAIVREWALSVPEVVHLTVATPYPGTETWFTESRGSPPLTIGSLIFSTRSCQPACPSSASTRSWLILRTF